jgi:hypothetical protein
MGKKNWSNVFGCPVEGEELLNDFRPLAGKMLCESIVRYLQKNNLIGRFEDGKFIVKKRRCISSSKRKIAK